jgi:hypothetical protein
MTFLRGSVAALCSRRMFFGTDAVEIIFLPGADFPEHNDADQREQRKARDIFLTARHDNQGGQQRPHGAAEVAAELKEGLRKTAPRACRHVRHA